MDVNTVLSMSNNLYEPTFTFVKSVLCRFDHRVIIGRPTGDVPLANPTTKGIFANGHLQRSQYIK
jgi:hypothetical protein